MHSFPAQVYQRMAQHKQFRHLAEREPELLMLLRH